MISPEWLQLLYALAGGLLGWWLKHRGSASPLPAEALELARVLLARRQQRRAEEALRGLLNEARENDAPEVKKGP